VSRHSLVVAPVVINKIDPTYRVNQCVCMTQFVSDNCILVVSDDRWPMADRGSLLISATIFLSYLSLDPLVINGQIGPWQTEIVRCETAQVSPSNLYCATQRTYRAHLRFTCLLAYFDLLLLHSPVRFIWQNDGGLCESCFTGANAMAIYRLDGTVFCLPLPRWHLSRADRLRG